MIFLFLGLSVCVFIVCLKGLAIVPRVNRVVVEGRDALAVMKSKAIGLDAKEMFIRAAALKMLGSFFSILGRVGLSVGIPMILVSLGIALEFYTVDEAVTVTSDWYFISGSILVMLIGWYIPEGKNSHDSDRHVPMA